MRNWRRVIAALAVAAACAPGTWLRAPVDARPPQHVTITHVAGPATVSSAAGWRREGVWQISAPGLRFGGFSAMLALRPGSLRAFSDRSFRLTLDEPGLPDADGSMNRQLSVRGLARHLTDIESATRDPASGQYWLGYEQTHAIQRFTIASLPAGERLLADLVDWPENVGIEAMVRLADGRFVIIPEAGDTGLIFARDPVAGGTPQRFRFRLPGKGYVATDAAQLPDGRLLVLLRRLEWPGREAWPPFSAMLAIAPPPRPGGIFAPHLVLRLDAVVPRENYEGLALRARDDGRVDVWVISDDNFSVFQRTLLVKLVFDPLA
ncbi:MAG: esterase-like activity of phytase family protein [Erythrobacter cryptus]